MTDRFRPIDRGMMPFAALRMPVGFNGQGILRLLSRDGGVGRLGVAIGEFAQIGGWGTGPEAPVVVWGVGNRQGELGAALEARGFARAARGGTPVWHLHGDFEADAEGRDTDPFAQALGYSQRFAVRDGYLLFSRGWPAMERMLEGGESLMDDADARAILTAGTASTEFGTPLDVILVPGQPDRVAALRTMLEPGSEGYQQRLDAALAGPGFALPGPPPFARYGLVLWQDGGATTGAIVIPYADAATATTARERFEALLGTMRSALVPRSFAELLPFERDFRVIETANRSVLVLAFRMEARGRVAPIMFSRNPRRRLADLMHSGDIALMIGSGG